MELTIKLIVIISLATLTINFTDPQFFTSALFGTPEYYAKKDGVASNTTTEGENTISVENGGAKITQRIGNEVRTNVYGEYAEYYDDALQLSQVHTEADLRDLMQNARKHYFDLIQSDGSSIKAQDAYQQYKLYREAYKIKKTY